MIPEPQADKTAIKELIDTLWNVNSFLFFASDHRAVN